MLRYRRVLPSPMHPMGNMANENEGELTKVKCAPFIVTFSLTISVICFHERRKKQNIAKKKNSGTELGVRLLILLTNRPALAAYCEPVSYCGTSFGLA